MRTEEFLEGLTPAQRRAVEILKAALDLYNTRDGVGLFTGPGRYGVLDARAALAAYQARSLLQFWAVLLRRMGWPTPPKRADEVVLPLLRHPDEEGVLQVLATETPSVVMLARALHEEGKTKRRESPLFEEVEDEG